MKTDFIFPAIIDLIKARFMNQRIPLAISWILTSRCNQKCLYCSVWKSNLPELNTAEVIDLIDQFHALGTKWITFSGGEPLLRDDLGEIVRHAKENGIFVTINSNGQLLPERIGRIKGIDRMMLSLDGPPRINDLIRGKGTYDAVMKAIDTCRSLAVPVFLDCVLSKFNLESIDELLKIASDRKTKILFQPATKQLLWSEADDPIAPPADQYRTVIKELIEKKRSGAPVYNSLAGLEHLYYWPENKNIFCSAGRIFFVVKPNGNIMTCDRLQGKNAVEIDTRSGVKNAISQLPPAGCRQCWCCSVVETNLMASLSPGSIMNFLANP